MRLSATELAEQIFDDQLTVLRWKNGNRLRDNRMIVQLARTPDENTHILLNTAFDSCEASNAIPVDDGIPILKVGISIQEEMIPDATVVSITCQSEVFEHAQITRIEPVFPDTETGR